jgi:hypothetical protein
MNDEHLDKLMESARDSYRVAPEPQLDVMWAAIDAELSGAPARWQVVRRSTRWGLIGLAAAATLALGVGLGRWSATSAKPDVLATAPTSRSVRAVSDVAEPLQRETSNYLGATEVLLRDLQDSTTSGAYASQATTLLVKTRLLLDSPAAGDRHLKDLLEDLELVLAQIATLRGQDSAPRNAADLQMIRSALADHDLVPRLRTAVVTLASSDED